MKTPFKILVAGALVATAGLVGGETNAWAANSCDALVDPIYQRSNPAQRTTLLTPWASEADKAAQNHGYVTDNGVAFKASTKAGDGLVPMHRLYRAATGDFVWLPPGPEKDSAVSKFGYADQGVFFHALASKGDCGTPVYRYLKGTTHHYAASQEARDALTADGWKEEGVSFYAVPAAPKANDTDTVFSLAALPDTQNEVNDQRDTRFKDRMQWLVNNKASLDLRHVLHSGDVTNWGWLEKSQYTMASDAFKVLDNAGIPYQAAIGNHDTRAVGYNGNPNNPGPGGAAYQDHPDCPKVLGAGQCDSRLLVRHTEEWNAAFPASRFKGVGGTFENGKSDNMYQTFSAGGVDWLVLSLELYPRAEAVEWAKQVVKANPKRNVIVVTHSYLTGDRKIRQDKEYGSTTPQYLFDNLIKVYPNIKMVFSGHVGQWGTRLDKGDNGNTIVSYLTTLHSNNNPVRTLEINTANGSVTSKLVTPNKGTSENDSTKVTLSFVK